MSNDLTLHNGGELARHDDHQPTPMEVIAAIAKDPSVPLDRIGMLIDLQERMESREAEKLFNRDFAAAMIEMPKVAKRGKKDMKEKGTIAYETYEDLDAAIRPIETKYGFARTFLTRAIDGRQGSIMTLRLTHRAGHSITSERLAPPDPGPGRNDIQAAGSGESYARRYMTKALWNIVTVGADDDGNSADPISDEQVLDIEEKLEYLAPTPQWYAKWWAWIGQEDHRVSAIQRKDWQRVHDDLVRRVKAEESRRAGK